MSDTLDLVALRRPVTVVLPSGVRVPVAPYRGHGIALLRQYRQETDTLLRAAQLTELLHLAIPTATDEDLDDTGPEDWGRIVASAAGKLELVEIALKNGLSDGVPEPAPSPSTDSTTTTTSPARSPE
jgi:hypothetical protein